MLSDSPSHKKNKKKLKKIKIRRKIGKAGHFLIGQKSTREVS